MPRRQAEVSRELAITLDHFVRAGMPRGDRGHEAFAESFRVYDDALKAAIANMGGERRALQTQIGVAGGYTLLPEWTGLLEVNLKRGASMFDSSTILWTDRGTSVGYPTVDDTANSANITEDNVSEGSSSDPSFGFSGFSSYEYPSGAVILPNSLLQDNGVALDEVLLGLLAVRCRRGMNPDLTTGTGGMRPRGIVTAATVTTTTASPTAFTYSEIMDLIFSVDAEYRSNPGAGFMMHDSVLKIMSKMVDGNGRPLLKFRREARDPADGKIRGTLLDYPVYSNNSMAAAANGVPAASQKLILFGDLSRYTIRLVKNPFIVRLVEQYQDKLQVAFASVLRGDGNLLDAGQHPVAALQQHA